MIRRLHIASLIISLFALLPSVAAAARVLRVGTYHGIRGQFTRVQAAVDAARPGDWVLLAPGDWKTTASRSIRTVHDDFPAAVLITTPRLHLRGMNRNTVVIDGTTRGGACNAVKADQNFGPRRKGGPAGLNGIMVWKADNVSVENLTACNFLRGSGDAGNEIWWNGGADGGQIGGWGFRGDYLTATSRFFDRSVSKTKAEDTAAAYGIFSSNWDGGTWDHSYASNMNDSDYYIGACQQECNQVINHAWAQFSALGYSGTNSGGKLIVENSQFDHNQEGFDTNSQNNSDWPSPQDGACPHNGISPITHTHSCWVFMHNYVHDNNNPNVPASGAAAASPVGTGLSTEGRNDTVMDNRFVRNGAWGVAFQPYPDTETPPPWSRAKCRGGISNYNFLGQNIRCLYDDWGNALIGNRFSGNGFFGNATNGDFGEITFTSGHPINCYRGNVDTSGPLTSSPSNLQQTNAQCGQIASSPDQNQPMVFQALCDTEILGSGLCPSGSYHYPRAKRIVMHALPRHLATMPNPCKGVPANPWCPARRR